MENKEIFSLSDSPSMSSDIRLIAQSLNKARSKFAPTGMSGYNAHQGWRYAKIDGIYDAVQSALGEQDIIIAHFVRPQENRIEYLFTRLIHTLSGQYIEDIRILESEKPGQQGKGAADTYTKKRALLALCAIGASDETDDDGAEEQKHIKEKETKGDKVQVAYSGMVINAARVKFLMDLMKGNQEREANFCSDFGVESVDRLPVEHMQDALDYLGYKPKPKG